MAIEIPRGTTESATPFKNVWPEPRSNSEDFINLFDSSKENKQFHVDFFKEHIRDFSRPNMFRVQFDFDSFSRSDESFLSKEACMITESLVKSVSIPSFEISKLEIKRMGQRIFLPALRTHQDIQITFMCDDDYTPRKFLHSWLKRFVYDTDYNYFKKIKTMSACNMTVYQLDNNFKAFFAVRFEKVFPSVIGEIQLSHDSDSQVVEFPATFCYSTYTILSDTQDDFGNK